MKKKKIFIITAAILVVIVGMAAGSLYYIDSKIFVPTKEGSKHSIASTVSTFQTLINSISNHSGVDNIVLAGTDARSKETVSRTDSIMMATVDGTNKAIKLTSFMRDMYVSIPGYSKNYKINSAYFFGGPDLLIDTLNQNFDTNANYFITIDFSAFQTLVDKLNGIDINVKPYEIKEMNKYIKQENWGNPEFIETSGLQHLNGQQVLSYCRIRKVGNNDYERTERQRRALTLLIGKARKQSIFKLPGLLNAMLPYIKTNIPSAKLLSFGILAYKYSKAPVSTLRVPADGMYSSEVKRGQEVLVPDLAKNKDLLNRFITSSVVTTPSSATQDNNDTSGAITERSSIDVSILNSTGKTGLAAEYKTKLEALGYKVTQTGNYPYKKYTETIINDYSNQGYGDILTKDLKFGNIIKKQKAKPLASIVVILGDDSVK